MAMEMKAFIVFLASFCCGGFAPPDTTCAQSPATASIGAWRTGDTDDQTIMICSGNFFSAATCSGKKVTVTRGGKYRIENGEWIETIEFHSVDPGLVGKEIRRKVEIAKGVLTFYDPAGKVRWQQLDAGGPGRLAGAWVITGRVRDGKLSKMNPGARRTMKILSGTRFQWIAYNVGTHEFIATGGGTYTTKDGKYTENIEFFSRDDSRVGASLTFDYAIEGGNWKHSGLSSRGEPVEEVWTEREKTGL